MTYTTTLPAKQNTYAAKPMKPLGWLGSLIIFAIPTLIVFIAFHLGIPVLEKAGLSSFEALVVTFTVPTALMFVASLVALIYEQSITTFDELRVALRTRMRFPKLTAKSVLYGVVAFLLLVFLGGIAGGISRLLVFADLVPLPESAPLLVDPRTPVNAESISAFVGGQIVGNWGVIILFAIQIFFNIVGEELWWRGYVLPRQELAFGKKAWLVHGLLWWGFHAFKWWDLIGVLPIALMISYVAQRYQNNWIPTITHLLANGIQLLIFAAAVVGLLG